MEGHFSLTAAQEQRLAQNPILARIYEVLCKKVNSETKIIWVANNGGRRPLALSPGEVVTGRYSLHREYHGNGTDYSTDLSPVAWTIYRHLKRESWEPDAIFSVSPKNRFSLVKIFPFELMHTEVDKPQPHLRLVKSSKPDLCTINSSRLQTVCSTVVPKVLKIPHGIFKTTSPPHYIRRGGSRNEPQKAAHFDPSPQTSKVEKENPNRGKTDSPSERIFYALPVKSEAEAKARAHAFQNSDPSPRGEYQRAGTEVERAPPL